MSEIDTSAEAVERLALAADEVWCDLLLLMGRASNEGHAVGQQLAYELRVKTRYIGETLRALVAERDAARATIGAMQRDHEDHYTKLRCAQLAAEAERGAARAEVERYRIALADLVSWQDAWPKMAQRLAQESHHMQDAVTAARAVLAGKDPDAALAAKGEA